LLTVTRTFTGSNHAPSFTSFPIQTGTAGSSYSYAVTIVDPDTADRLTLALLVAPPE